MKKLAKFLKPFIAGIVLVFVLLFGQALCDLNLPNYMSDIVNVGIQQSGVEHAAPDTISTTGLRLMTMFMTDEDSALVDTGYMVPETTSSVVFCTLKGDIGRDDRDALDEAFGRASWALVCLLRDMVARSGQTTVDSDAAMPELDVTMFYNYLPQLESLPPEALASYLAQGADVDPMMRRQSGIAFAKAFYEEVGADIGKMQTEYIVRTGLMMLLIALAGGVATVLVSLIASRCAAGVARDLRGALFDKVSSFSHAEFDKFSTASLITRSTNDVTQIQMFLTFGLRLLCYAPIMAAGGVIMAVRKSASMAWILALAGAVLLGLILVVFAMALPKFQSMQKLVDKLNLVSREHLSGLMVIRAFGAEAHEKQRFDKANQDLSRTTLFVNRVMVTMFPVMMLVMNGISLLIIWTGAHQIAEASIQVGDMMAFMQYAMMVIMSFLMVSMMFIFVPRAAVAASRIAEVLETEPSIVDPPDPKVFDIDKRGLVEFINVHFRYHGAQEDALRDITFTAQPGQTTAFIGATGSGKTTMLNLLLRFYDVTDGAVLVDGVDVRQARQDDLRARIGLVPQQGVLLTGSIASNIKYGAPDISDEEMETTAAVAQAMEFIAQKENRFDDGIAQGGTNVSGGQKQRLSIARALAKKPEILVFDDSFSALDFKTDRALRAALREHTGDSTVLLVAQRVSTILHADRIIVLDEGEIVGMGTHKELLRSCPQYHEIASSQLTKEELAQ